MRKRLLSSARLSANIGRLMAGEFTSVFHREAEKRLSQQDDDRRMAEVTGSLRHAVYETVDSFNRHLPWDFQLAVLDKGDRLVFNSLGEFTLTMHYGKGHLTMQPASGEGIAQDPMLVEVWLDEEGLRFRDCSAADAEPRPPLDQTTFLATVIRMACSPRFYEESGCQV